MDIDQCWMRYMKAGQLMQQGHWPEAHRLYEDVLNHLPNHIHSALENDQSNAEWMIELNHVTHAHEQFLHLQAMISREPDNTRLYN
ncbi:MAG: hypothetical protein GYB40_02180 [Vibrionaceae bacterium]|nr:hypothetical protein [Vibrionaceae bacterium]